VSQAPSTSWLPASSASPASRSTSATGAVTHASCQAQLLQNHRRPREFRALLTVIAGRDNFAVCDLAGAFGFCWLSAAVAADRDYMRYHFLDSMVYAPLEYQRLTSVHAACVALNGRGLLLFGGTGAGKTCLAFACAKSGWSLITDEGSALVRGTHDNVVLGNPYHLRFRESAIVLFPELAEAPRSTTRAVVMSIFLVVVVDLVFTALFFFLSEH